MSIFHYPRINIAGRLRLNPGTANSEDYAQPRSGQALMDPESRRRLLQAWCRRAIAERA